MIHAAGALPIASYRPAMEYISCPGASCSVLPTDHVPADKTYCTTLNDDVLLTSDVQSEFAFSNIMFQGEYAAEVMPGNATGTVIAAGSVAPNDDTNWKPRSWFESVT